MNRKPNRLYVVKEIEFVLKQPTMKTQFPDIFINKFHYNFKKKQYQSYTNFEK